MVMGGRGCIIATGGDEMANCIAKATGVDKTRDKNTHRLGSVGASVEAATWETHAYAYVAKDGSGHISVTRNGRELHSFHFPAEA